MSEPPARSSVPETTMFVAGPTSMTLEMVSVAPAEMVSCWSMLPASSQVVFSVMVIASLPPGGPVAWTGGDSADSFTGFQNAKIYGGSGDDTYLNREDGDSDGAAYGGQGDDTLDGGDVDFIRNFPDRGVPPVNLPDHVDLEAQGYALYDATTSVDVYGGSGDDVLSVGLEGTGEGGIGDDVISGRGEMSGQAGNDSITAYGHGEMDGGSGDDNLTFDRKVYADAQQGAIDLYVTGSEEMIDMSATGGAGADTFTLSNQLFTPEIDYQDGPAAAGSAAEADIFATAFPGSDMIGTITDFDPAEDLLVLELPEAATGYSLSDMTATKVDGEEAVDLEITMKHDTDATQPDLVRTIRLTGLTSFDTDMVQQIMVETPPIAVPAI